MTTPSMQDLLEAGMHFGHLTRRWNPKMKPFIYGVRNGVHIIDLSKTVKLFRDALDFVAQAVGNGSDVLFVGTKKQAQDVIEEEAKRCGMYYVNNRWLGGTLTNFRTIKSSIDRLKELQRKKEDGTFAVLSKKEILMIDREIERYQRSLGGIQDMTRLPGIMVMIDPNLEHIALHEANVLNIPIVALGDTNCDPDPIDRLVPGNDDALRSIKLFVAAVADQVLEGLRLREAQARRAPQDRDEGDKPAHREAKGEKGVAYVGRGDAAAGQEEVEEGSYSARVQPEAPVEVPPETDSEKVE